ncbi:MAG TPA: phosphoribosylglycinamide formyltransferase [Steroidobacteraceae bacterium]|jgi:phosphoribosylglycinamide formyltransferase-1
MRAAQEPALTPAPIVILISGRGSNMRVIAEAAAKGSLAVKVAAVVSDRADAAGLAIAREMQIPAVSLSPRDYTDRPAYDAALAKLVASFDPRLVVLAGFMRILTPNFITPFAGRLLNIHPSLLPRHRGLHTHRRVLEAAETTHGASVHFVTEELDGGPVIVQASIDVRAHDDEASLSARVQQQEHRIYVQAIDWFANGRLRWDQDRAWLDGNPLQQPVMTNSG